MKWGDFGDFTLCGDLGFLEGFYKAISHVNAFVVILWWKCSGNCLVSCVFDTAWVILESKKSIKSPQDKTSLKLSPIFAVVFSAGDRDGISYCPLPVCRKQSGSWGSSWSRV